MKPILLILLLIGGSCIDSSAAPAPRYAEGRVLVTFKPWRDPTTAKAALQRHGLKFSRRFAKLSALRSRQTGVVRDDSRSTAQLIATLKSDPAIETVEPDYVRHVSVSATPNDTSFNTLWALRNFGQTANGKAGTSGADIKFIPARDLLRPNTNAPVVGVIDTGADRMHPDLESNIWHNPGEVPFNGIDDDHNGFVDDAYGFNFEANRADTSDAAFHGTHVCGTIAATGNNAMGVIGVNDRARLMIMRASSNGEFLSNSAIIAALNYAVMMKTRAIDPVNIVSINASFYGLGSSSIERDAYIAAGNAGIIICACAGNKTSDNDTTRSPTGERSASSTNTPESLSPRTRMATVSPTGRNTSQALCPSRSNHCPRPATP